MNYDRVLTSSTVCKFSHYKVGGYHSFIICSGFWLVGVGGAGGVCEVLWSYTVRSFAPFVNKSLTLKRLRGLEVLLKLQPSVSRTVNALLKSQTNAVNTHTAVFSSETT